MELYFVTKGNFCLDKTRDIRPLENNLRFHFKIEEKHYEYDLCNDFDKFSGSQQKENLIRYLKSFADRDSVPENYYQAPEDDKENDQVSFTK